MLLLFVPCVTKKQRLLFTKSNSVSAMINIANIYVIEQNYTAAMAQYKKVLAIEPSNKTALKGIESLNTKMGNFDE